MKTAFKPNLKSKTFGICESYSPLKERGVILVNFKFYQKFFVVLISLSTILIFPESPRELESICERYNSENLCNVW